jgi:hypothetical protein
VPQVLRPTVGADFIWPKSCRDSPDSLAVRALVRDAGDQSGQLTVRFEYSDPKGVLTGGGAMSPVAGDNFQGTLGPVEPPRGAGNLTLTITVVAVDRAGNRATARVTNTVLVSGTCRIG